MFKYCSYLSILPTLLSSFFLIACSRSSNEAQGYIEGNYTYMATSVSGVVKELTVDKGMRVKQGQLLFVLEEQPESDELDAAAENLAEAQAQRDATAANLDFAKITYERYKILVPKNAIERSALDNAKSNFLALSAQLSQANANIAEAKATLAQAKWKKDQKTIYAPKDAIVYDKYFRLGEFAEANQPILSLLAPGDIKAIFYVNQNILGSLKLNDKVHVNCDGCKITYTGYISFISPTAEYTPPVIYSTETNEKLVFRIEAKFPPEQAYDLHPGQPVYVKYFLNKANAS